MTSRIVGVNRSTLWQAWKEIRTALRHSTVRDVVDYLDYDIDPEIWIRRLLRHIKAGTYEPQAPIRFTLAKSGGFERRLTMPMVPDIVLFRALSDYVHGRARRHQQPHVYYRRSDLAKAVEAATNAAVELQKLSAFYRFTSAKSFRNWRDYEQYRKQLILEKVYRYIVITDVTNFFDTVLHSEVSNAFRQYPVPSRLVGLLFYLLERLAIRADYSDSPGIGLPVDEFECSRTIANLLLFPHDKRMTELVGKKAYVRWMDDQVVGVNSRVDGLRAVTEIGKSLSSLYLTANAKKTRVLSLKEAKVYFHLETNAKLDDLEKVVRAKRKSRRGLVRILSKIWGSALRHKDVGEWEKIQKRVYRLAGLTRAKFLRKRAMRDVLSTPTLTERISDYMRCSGSSVEHLTFVKRVLASKEQIHDDVELVLLEGLLRLEARGETKRKLLKLAELLLREIDESKRSHAFAAPVCLLVLRFGDRRKGSVLSRCFRDKSDVKHPSLIRSSAICYSTYGSREFGEVRRAATLLLVNPLALMVRMVRRLQSIEEVPDRFKNRLAIRWDSVRGRNYVDMRTYVAARLLMLNHKKSVRLWLRQWVVESKKKSLSAFDRRLIRQLVG